MAISSAKWLTSTGVCHLDSVSKWTNSSALSSSTSSRAQFCRFRKLLDKFAATKNEAWSNRKTASQHHSCVGISKGNDNYKFPLAPLCNVQWAIVHTHSAKNWMAKINKYMFCSGGCACVEYRVDTPCTRIRHHRVWVWVWLWVWVWVCVKITTWNT